MNFQTNQITQNTVSLRACTTCQVLTCQSQMQVRDVRWGRMRQQEIGKEAPYLDALTPRAAFAYK